MRIMKIETSIEGIFKEEKDAITYMKELGIKEGEFILKGEDVEARIEKEEGGSIIYRFEKTTNIIKDK